MEEWVRARGGGGGTDGATRERPAALGVETCERVRATHLESRVCGLPRVVAVVDVALVEDIKL